MQETTPLNAQQAQLLSQLVDGLSTEQLAWVRGFLAGINHSVRHAGAQTPAGTAPGPAAPHLTILYGSQTGHAQEVAEHAKARAADAGFKVDLFAMGDYKASRLKSDKLLLVAVSTQGEGEPPDDARDFYEFLHGAKAPRLEGTRYAVLGLGDSSYEKFCQAAKDFDARLAALGAERLVSRVDSDVDYDAPAERWIEDTVEALKRVAAPASPAATPTTPTTLARGIGSAESLTLAAFAGGTPAMAASTRYSRKRPFDATVIENITLSGRGSSKEVHHIELSLEGAGLTYEPGDAVGVVVKNDDALVDELIDTLALDPQATTTTQDSTLSLRDAFLRAYDITTLSRAFLEKYAALSASADLKALLAAGNETALRDYLYGRDVLDVVRQFPARKVKAAEFVGTLRALQPRLYSIASSLAANPDAVHITVGAVRYESHGRTRRGVASTYLADFAREGETVPIYIEANRNFKLPSDTHAPVIMIGPGTGIAPFRAFVEERQALDSPGKNWLFFGDRNFRTDFLYQREWQRYVKDGVLTRIDLAFSRDTQDKVYVQHRMREQGKALYEWLQEGAHLYVCGDADAMARDVNTALVDIVVEHGGLSQDAATEYVKTLQREKRYQRDVY
ncbi:assimilatory sulfite reductase (NADPH) flavoprotein subunit [Pandoraea apista]|uniref:Sulfite reductase [NADPH] flavoprotein alpha-component n=6 Tax=Pandoraea apista TaxID=93218 RepID=A0ABX9ZJI4_9BURK|nr:assimilatory sulfite reductase (NADPH) flavoprotein subunit [Pandoraea apista]PTE00909.1 sulfite reductase [NADPH] flavoprotein alpha-component [Pandoraea apista]RRJ26255.1 assimilatory sulfite reductase (NADPH) flavoprotein subunit [Pandoraea apista]RSD17557.1 assimilatory sulfite reductase (NADPH) flavoprotein subunit [Pandoraea apista]RSK76330.1 assimilatory sulfite reductase (NADPH) flavoprotein subunit [Pandoraea apista]RSK82792.1 assimilatory sulfite reductase (NADPH) flavoprotein sub